MFQRSRIVVRSNIVVLREILFCSFSSFFGFAGYYVFLVSNARACFISYYSQLFSNILKQKQVSYTKGK